MTDLPARTVWVNVPDAPPLRDRLGIGALIAAEAPLVIAMVVMGRPRVECAAVVISAILCLVASYLLRRSLRPWFFAAAVCLVAPFVGGVIAIVAIPGLALWMVATGESAATDGQRDRRQYRPLLAPLLFSTAALLLVDSINLAAFAVLLAGLLGALIGRFPSLGRRSVALADDVGGIVGALVGALVTTMALVVTVIFWAAYRVTGHDPLRQGRSSPAWISIRDLTDPRRSGEGLAWLQVSPGQRRRRAVAHVIVVTAVVALAVTALVRPTEAPISDAFASDPEWPGIWRDQAAFNSHPEFNVTTIWSMKDFRSEFVNQVDDARATWSPPACECERKTVWWYGGSAAWGFYQKDDDTIPSQLAKLAWSEGVALDIVNVALPGFSLSQEVQQFAQMSADGTADLAIFYDGANELYLQVNRNNQGRGTDESPASYAESTLNSVISFAAVPSQMRSRSVGTTLESSGAAEPVSAAADVSRYALSRYRRELSIANWISDASGIPMMAVWQPTLSTAPDVAIDEWDPLSPPSAVWHRELVQAARSELPREVVDLSDVFNGADRPIFPDWAHTNADGAKVVARELWSLLRNDPSLE